MNTRQYYYLSTIANYGNLSHAAQALHVSPSALSKFLAECERTFGFALFLRYNRRLYPTAVGRYVVECAQKILDEQNRMLLTMKEVTGGNRKAIRLATAPNRGAIIFSKIYNQFSRRYPDISLSLTELYAAEQPGAIARGLVDLALGAGATSSEITDIPIAHEELLVSLPASHPLAKQETIHLADLRDTPFVLQGPRHSIRLIAEQLFQQAGFQPVVAFESNDVILLDSMMHQAVGVGLVSNAHVFPCSELAYRPLNPPVHQTLHLRFPLGHTLTEPERYLAGLLITERLRDPRYKPTDDPLVDQLLQEVLSPSQLADTGSLPREAVGTALQTMQEVNLDSRVMEYLIFYRGGAESFPGGRAAFFGAVRPFPPPACRGGDGGHSPVHPGAQPAASHQCRNHLCKQRPEHPPHRKRDVCPHQVLPAGTRRQTVYQL